MDEHGNMIREQTLKEVAKMGTRYTLREEMNI